jgi:hypothetical protein
MEGILASFFSVETVVFCIVIWLAVLVTRRVVQAAAKKIAKIFPDKWEPWWIEAWRHWMLPALPLVAGALMAFGIPAYPFPEVFAASATGRIFFGLVAGGASGYAYRFFKLYLKKLLPEKVQELEEKISENALPPAEDSGDKSENEDNEQG